MRTALVILFVFFGVGLAGLCIGGRAVYAESDEVWLEYPASIAVRSPVETPSEGHICSAAVLSIEVVGNGHFKDACVYGTPGSMRVARFFTGLSYLYAVAFPNDGRYYELRGGCALSRCVYASGTDTLVSHKNITPYVYGGVVYKNFSQHLERRFDPAKNTYYFRFVSSPDYAVAGGTHQFAVESVALSKNGKWALFELRGYGIVRLDVIALEARRVIAPGADYGLGHDPSYELAISDDGREVVAVGKGLGFRFVHVNDTCGDYLVEGTQPRYASNIIPCTGVPISSAGLPQTYDYFTRPQFDASGRRLGVTVRYHDASAERIMLSPAGPAPVRHIDYLALGDSFTSGEGELQDSYYRPQSLEMPTRCHVSTRSYPYLLGNLWGSTTESVACSGARTVDIVRSSSYMGQGDALRGVGLAERQRLSAVALTDFRAGVLAQEEFVSAYQPRVVTVGVGGNDAGLVGKLSACLGIGTCEWVNDPAKRYATAQEIADLYPKLQQVIEALRSNSPQSHIAVVGYPHIINTAPGAACDIITGTLLDADERVFMRETIHYLNQVIKAAAYAQKVAFADIEQSLTGHELCQGANTSAMNGVRFGNDIAPIKALSEFRVFGAESFHPTPLGHQVTAQILFGQYPTGDGIALCKTDCDREAQVPEPSAYWFPENPEVSTVQQRYDPTISKALLRPGGVLEVSTPPLQFMPGSLVKIELHSEPLVLGEGRADSNGTLTYTTSISSKAARGYHTLHLLGTSGAGEPLDLYHIVAIADEPQGQTERVVGGHTLENYKPVASPHSTANRMTTLVDSTEESPSKHVLGAVDTPHHRRLVSAIQNPKQSGSQPGVEDAVAWIGLTITGVGVGVFALWARWHSRYSSRDRG